MAENKNRECPRDCTKCGIHQHAFCAAQMGFYLMEKIHSLEQKIDELHNYIVNNSVNEPKILINPPLMANAEENTNESQ